MTAYDAKPKRQKMRVVKGKKLEQKRRLGIFAYALSVIVVISVIFQLIIPAGITETLSNALAVMGTCLRIFSSL